MDRLTGKVAIVTGAGAGIGRAVALRLAAAGCAVGLLDLDEAGITDTRQQVEAADRRAASAIVASAIADVSSREQVNAGILALTKTLGPVDILVNNAGILNTCGFLDITDAQWRRAFAVNLDGAFFCCQAVLGSMVERKSGCIINMASWTGKQGIAHHTAYGATKAALINLTQSLAAEFGPQGIRAHAVCPGIIADTDMRAAAEDRNRTQGQPALETRVQAVPLRRAGLPSEVADLVAFLASDCAAYMTGQAINVAGGLWMN